ncbi:hypothetical protein IFR09_05260 [Pseudomonas syringae]|nr:hypothetical protein [Pseudomonas syringae]MBD8791801.1 hypothetical protein [Pseudomonas syringae]MBD8801161.1 hypothetical protein [Pseudomonas syringae]MBD8810565.1 hypothetical protein [Pseudomonas syringae]
MQYEFPEVLNDLIDYFLLGDIRRLQRFKDEQQLGDDLAAEFVSNDSGDRAVLEGVLIPLAGVENHPYTVLFTLDDTEPELFKPGSRLQHRRDGYVLQVESGRVHLFTWRILQDFTPVEVEDLLQRYADPAQGRPTIEVANGWYEVQVLAGEIEREGSLQPAFEFILSLREGPLQVRGVDINYRFAVQWE